MSQKGRVLIIDDDGSLRTAFATIVENAGYEVDAAETRAEALEKIRRRTYQVAMIDIMLTDDPSERGGIACVEYIARLNEGTVPIVLSATSDVRAPVEAWRKGALDYLIKKDIRSSEEILDAVRRGVEKCSVNFYGPFERLTGYLGYPEAGWSFEDTLMRVLGADMGKGYGAMDKLFAPLLPVLRAKNSSYTIVADAKRRSMEGFLWSKSIGGAIWFSLSAGFDEPAPPPSSEETIELLFDIREDKVWHGRARVWRMSKPRDFFDESLFDIGPAAQPQS